MRTVLDTSVLLSPAPGPLDRARHQLGVLGPSCTSVLVARSDDVRAERLRRLGVIERTFEALPVDASTARHYGRLAAAVTAVGRSPRARVMDLLIAATAAAHGARLATRNAADLHRIEELVEVVELGSGPATRRGSPPSSARPCRRGRSRG